MRVCHTRTPFLLCLAGMGSDDLLNMGQGSPPPPSPGSIPGPGSLGGGSQVGAYSGYFLRLLVLFFVVAVFALVRRFGVWGCDRYPEETVRPLMGCSCRVMYQTP